MQHKKLSESQTCERHHPPPFRKFLLIGALAASSPQLTGCVSVNYIEPATVHTTPKPAPPKEDKILFDNCIKSIDRFEESVKNLESKFKSVSEKFANAIKTGGIDDKGSALLFHDLSEAAVVIDQQKEAVREAQTKYNALASEYERLYQNGSSTEKVLEEVKQLDSDVNDFIYMEGLMLKVLDNYDNLFDASPVNTAANITARAAPQD